MLELTMYDQIELLIRIFVAGICGALIGYERKSRLKEAGIRTHFIVALASALMMVISKYGFFDLLNMAENGQDIRLDPSRMASTIITGVGFLGAGAIFIRKNTINGLTTAAGIWATAGVGMAIGTGFYFIGVVSTFIMLVVQIFLHRKNWFTKKIPTSETVKIVVKNEIGSLVEINEILARKHIELLNIKTEVIENGQCLAIEMHIKVPTGSTPIDVVNIFSGNDKIKSIDV